MGKRVLIIDDNSAIVEILSEIITDLFETVDISNNVEDAQNFLLNNTYDIVFLDINLGERNGAEVVKFLLENKENANLNVPFVIVSGIITTTFVDKFSKRFAGILMKPFSHDDVRNITETILGLRSAPAPSKILSEATLDEIPNLKCEMPFPLIQLEQRVSKILDQVRKSSNMKQLFSQLKIDRSESQYNLTHVGMIINISTAICMELEWSSDKTLEKFVYAAYLHDMAISDRPEFAKLNTFESLEDKRNELTAEEYKIILEHPNIAGNTVVGMREIPADVEAMLRQHHELPNGKGYPSKCTHQKITPLTSVFIVAHDLTEFILNNQKWTLNDYVEKSRGHFPGANFIKIFKALGDIKT
jgi:response regulator RpfG family c-di-GMP phosphodiesterase